MKRKKFLGALRHDVVNISANPRFIIDISLKKKRRDITFDPWNVISLFLLIKGDPDQTVFLSFIVVCGFYDFLWRIRKKYWTLISTEFRYIGYIRKNWITTMLIN